MGAAADGWWRDRPAAARRLLGRVQCYAAATGASIELVFDVALPDLAEGEHDGVVVRYATRSGRDAADDRIRDLLDSAADAGGRAGRGRHLGPGAGRECPRHAAPPVTGAGSFLTRLDDAGC